MKLLILFGILIFSVQIFAQNKNVALKFDEFNFPRNLSFYFYDSYDYRYDSEKSFFNEEKISFYDRVIRFAKELVKRKDTIAYIILYNQRKGSYPLQTGEIESREVVRILTNSNPKYLISRNRISVINGGFRETPTLEFWIVPTNAEPPKPTPTFNLSEIAVCPKINVAGDGFRKNRNQLLKFSVAIKDQAPDSKLDLEWNVSAGKIIKGQNTNQIEIDLSETSDKFISASVTVKGLHPECDNHKFASTQIGLFPYKLDEFPQIYYSELRMRLDGFMNFVFDEPNSIGYVFIYANRNKGRLDALRITKSIKDHIRLRGFDQSRMMVFDGGYREEMMVELYIVPAGAEPPKPTPTLDAQFVVEPKKTTKKQPKTKK